MTTDLEQFVLATTAASRISDTQALQSLWSGYGQIIRFYLEHPERNSVVVKCTDPPQQRSHPEVGIRMPLRCGKTPVHGDAKLANFIVENRLLAPASTT